MATTTHKETIDASAASVWKLVGNFTDNSWMGVDLIAEGDGLGATRKVSMPTGVITELCEVLDDETRTIGYAIVDGNPFPATDYHGLITIDAINDATCELTWSARYEPTADAAQVDDALARFLRGAARAVKRSAEQVAG